jgi:ABC-type antimicrobial peptide transport system permease subunit
MRPQIVSFGLCCFAVLAVLVASIGIYSVVDCALSQRTREIALRLALGASCQRLFWLVISDGLKLVVPGLVTGVIVAWAAALFVSSLLFSVSPTDPPIFATVVLLLAGIAFLASYLPARRAMAPDPMRALRCD